MTETATEAASLKRTKTKGSMITRVRRCIATTKERLEPAPIPEMHLVNGIVGWKGQADSNVPLNFADGKKSFSSSSSPPSLPLPPRLLHVRPGGLLHERGFLEYLHHPLRLLYLCLRPWLCRRPPPALSPLRDLRLAHCPCLRQRHFRRLADRLSALPNPNFVTRRSYFRLSANFVPREVFPATRHCA